MPRSSLDRITQPRVGDEVQILRRLGDSTEPVRLDELLRMFPDRAQAIRRVVAQLEMDGLIEVTDDERGKSVRLTDDGLAARRHL